MRSRSEVALWSANVVIIWTIVLWHHEYPIAVPVGGAAILSISCYMTLRSMKEKI